jgi:hypothetical protein
MHKEAHTSAESLSHSVEPIDASNAGDKARPCHTTRRAMLAGAAMLPALSLPAEAGRHHDAEVVDLARRLIARIEAERSLRLELEAAWTASERLRRQLLAAGPHLQDEPGLVHDLVQRTEQGRARTTAYERWNEACRECRAIAERIQTENVHTGPGLAAQVLAYYYLERGIRGKLNGGPLLRAAVALLGEKLPPHLNEDSQEEGVPHPTWTAQRYVRSARAEEE